MGEVVLARTSPTLHPPSSPTGASIVAKSTLRVKKTCELITEYADEHEISLYDLLTLTVLVTRWHWDTLKQGIGGSRVGEVRAGTTSTMPEHKGFMLQ